MIKLRLFRNSTIDYLKLLDEASLTNIESTDDISSVLKVLGRMLSTYVDSLKNPNLVSVLTTDDLSNWTLMDFKCIQQQLLEENFSVELTDDAEDAMIVNTDEVRYTLIDSTNLVHQFIPTSRSVTYKKNNILESFKVIDAIKALLDPYSLYPENKFMINPVKQCLDNLDQAKQLLGTINNYEMTRLIRILNNLGLRILVYSHD